jgi:hypothetical protein
MKFKSLALGGVAAASIAALPAQAAEKTFQIGSFDGVSVSAGIIAQVAVGGAASARAEGTDEGIEKLEVFVKDNELIIRRKPMSGFNWGDRQRVTVYVTAPKLNRLDSSSGSRLVATGIDSSDFSIDVSSGSSSEVTGRCTTLAVDASSGAALKAATLKCENVTVDGSSGASARVYASKSVIADASSGASVHVSGSPKNVNIDESSGGNVSVGE